MYQLDKKEVKGRRMRVIGYYSYSFTKAERNYTVTEKEALAVIKAVKYFRSHLEGGNFVIHTDHQALTSIMKKLKPRNRLARWQIFLQSFEYEIIHWKGGDLADADAISRLCVTPMNKASECFATNEIWPTEEDGRLVIPEEKRQSLGDVSRRCEKRRTWWIEEDNVQTETTIHLARHVQ